MLDLVRSFSPEDVQGCGRICRGPPASVRLACGAAHCAGCEVALILPPPNSKRPLPLAALARTRMRTRTPVDDDPLVSLLELSPDLLALLCQISCIPLETP